MDLRPLDDATPVSTAPQIGEVDLCPLDEPVFTPKPASPAASMPAAKPAMTLPPSTSPIPSSKTPPGRAVPLGAMPPGPADPVSRPIDALRGGVTPGRTASGPSRLPTIISSIVALVVLFAVVGYILSRDGKSTTGSSSGCEPSSKASVSPAANNMEAKIRRDLQQFHADVNRYRKAMERYPENTVRLQNWLESQGEDVGALYPTGFNNYDLAPAICASQPPTSPYIFAYSIYAERSSNPRSSLSIYQYEGRMFAITNTGQIVTVSSSDELADRIRKETREAQDRSRQAAQDKAVQDRQQAQKQYEQEYERRRQEAEKQNREDQQRWDQWTNERQQERDTLLREHQQIVEKQLANSRMPLQQRISSMPNGSTPNVAPDAEPTTPPMPKDMRYKPDAERTFPRKTVPLGIGDVERAKLHMENLWADLQEYREDNNGKLPARLWDLTPRYTDNAGIRSPVSKWEYTYNPNVPERGLEILAAEPEERAVVAPPRPPPVRNQPGARNLPPPQPTPPKKTYTALLTNGLVVQGPSLEAIRKQHVAGGAGDEGIAWALAGWLHEEFDKVPFGKFCRVLLSRDDAFAGVDVGPAAKGRDDKAYAVYRDATRASFGDVAPKGSAVREVPNAKVNAVAYDRYVAEHKPSGKTVTVFIGVENGHCVSYWFFGPSKHYAAFQSAIGKVTVKVTTATRPAS